MPLMPPGRGSGATEWLRLVEAERGRPWANLGDRFNPPVSTEADPPMGLSRTEANPSAGDGLQVKTSRCRTAPEPRSAAPTGDRSRAAGCRGAAATAAIAWRAARSSPAENTPCGSHPERARGGDATPGRVAE